MRAPHERLGLSAAQYSLWLDEHSSDEALESIAGSLEGAEGAPEVSGDAGAGEALSVMRSLLSGVARR